MYRKLTALAAIVGVGALATAAPAASPHLPIYSVRTERGAGSHTLTTVAFPVTVRGTTYLCIVTEDGATQGYSGTTLALSQSCDFSVGR